MRRRELDSVGRRAGADPLETLELRKVNDGLAQSGSLQTAIYDRKLSLFEGTNCNGKILSEYPIALLESRFRCLPGRPFTLNAGPVRPRCTLRAMSKMIIKVTQAVYQVVVDYIADGFSNTPGLSLIDGISWRCRK